MNTGARHGARYWEFKDGNRKLKRKLRRKMENTQS